MKLDRKRAVVVTVLVGAGALAGCGERAGGAARVSGSEPSAVAGAEESSPLSQAERGLTEGFAAADVVLPAAVDYSDADAATILSAWERVVQQCSVEAGIAYQPTLGMTSPPSARWDAELHTVSFDDADAIAREGYQWLRRHPTDPQLPVRSDADGAAHDACTRQADLTVGGGKGVLMNEVPGVAEAWGSIKRDTLASSELAPFVDTWNECMTASGFPEARLSDQITPSDTPPRAEIDRAVADSRCRQSTGYTTAKLALYQAATAEWIASHQSDIDAVRAARTAEVERAEAVLNSTN